MTRKDVAKKPNNKHATQHNSKHAKKLNHDDFILCNNEKKQAMNFDRDPDNFPHQEAGSMANFQKQKSLETTE